MAVRKELIEELLANRNPEEVFAQDGLLDVPKVGTFLCMLVSAHDVPRCVPANVAWQTLQSAMGRYSRS